MFTLDPSAPLEQCMRDAPLWFLRAKSEFGVKEIKGHLHEARIVEYWKTARMHFRDDETPWCAAYVGAMLELSGIRCTRSAAARSYTKWGTKIEGPALGCVVVFWRGSRKGWSGHVAFVAGRDTEDRLICLGGNQGDKVSYKSFLRDGHVKSRVLGYYWPATIQGPNSTNFFDLPIIGTSEGLSQNEA